MKFLSKAEFDTVAATDSYYDGRWVYFSHAIAMLNDLSIRGKVLEIGAYKLPLVKNCDIMDIAPAVPVTYKQDATITPWNIADKRYDLCIALQVFEHLGNKQKEVFTEIKRISNYALLSFPYRWNCPEDPTHHNITLDTIDEWTLRTPTHTMTQAGIRRIYLYSFAK